MSKHDVWPGTLALMVLKSLAALGPVHGYGLGRRIEETSGERLRLNYGTLYPALLRLVDDGAIGGSWGTSENGRRARFYKITAAGRKQLERAERDWKATTEIVARFLSPARGRG